MKKTFFLFLFLFKEPNSSEKIKIEKKVHSTVQDEKKLIPHDDLGPSQIDLLHQLKKGFIRFFFLVFFIIFL